MKGKSLKLWQAIILVFASILLVVGGVVLYNYLTTGFENEIIQPEGISFGIGDGQFNSSTNQFEVDSNFSLTINATNETATEKNITLSFAKSKSSEKITNDTFTKNGVTYITNGIIAVPQNVQIGKSFEVIVEQKQYSEYEDIGSFTANVGGITTLHAKSSNILDSTGADINIAVDVPVEKVELKLIDTSTSREYDINEDGVASVFQNANFTIDVNYYPQTSRYRYSDQIFADFYALEGYTQRVKTYCYEITSGNNVKMNYNNGDIYFSASSLLGAGNNIKVYVFETAKQQEAFEALGSTAEGENYYNVMLSYLAKSESGVVSKKINCDIQQASVGSMNILNTTFIGKTNKLFTLTANNEKVGDATLKLLIADTEGSALPSMISQIGIKFSYKKAGDVEFTPLNPSDKTVSIKSKSKVNVGNELDQNNPYEYEGSYYYFANSQVKDLNNSYWEISTIESSIDVKLEVALFVTTTNENGNLETTIFDEDGSLLGGLSRTAKITFTENLDDEGDVEWSGSLTESKSIVYKGNVQVPTELKLGDRVQVPSSNNYQKIQYYIAKLLDENGSLIDAGGNPIQITTADANIVDGTYDFDGKTYSLLSSSDVLFKTAGTYSVIFVTIKTDAYGEIILDKDDKIIPVKTSRELTVNVAKTLQEFEKTNLTVSNAEDFGVFVRTTDETPIVNKSYFTYDAVTEEYNLAAAPNLTGGVAYYEVDYYAIKSGTLNAITLDIKVAESDCTLIEKELDNGKLKFFAVSADGEHELLLTWEADAAKQDNNGETEYRVKPIRLSLPDVQMNYNNGFGKGFYIIIEYDNSLEKIRTVVEINSNEAIVDEEKCCFMIYTPSPEAIKNVTLLGDQVVKPNDSFNRKKYFITVNMDENAKYTECDVKTGSFTNSETVNGMQNGKEWLNEQIANTIVYDAYGRRFEREGEPASYDLGVSQGVNSVYIIKDPDMGPMIEFASGTEELIVTISSGECQIAFELQTRSYGLGLVDINGQQFTTFTNVHINTEGASRNTYDLPGKMTVYVGQIDASSGRPINTLKNVYFYLKETTNADLLEMFTFKDSGGHVIPVSALTTTPIAQYSINSFFATGATLTFIASNVDYTNPTEETVRFEYKVNIEKSVEVTAKYTDDDLGDGVYSAYQYDLNEYISIKKTAGYIDPTWASAYSGQWYIDASGNVTNTSSSVDVGAISNGKLYFYDVNEARNINVKLYFYNTNDYAYHNDATFKVYPNVQFVKSTGVSALDAIDLGELSVGNTTVSGVNNYFTVKRIKGSMTIEYDLEVTTENSPIDFTANSTTFVWTGETVNLDYNQNNMPISIKLKMNGSDVYDKDGNAIIYNNLSAYVFNNYANMLGWFLKYNDEYVGTVNFNDTLALKVESNIKYTGNTSKLDVGTNGGEYIYVISTDNNIYNTSKQNCIFVDPINGYGFGENYYLLIRVCNGIEGNANTKVLATMKIPVFVSGVGQEFAYYKDYNEQVLGSDFDLKILLNGDQDKYPYATYTAGKQIKLTYSTAELYRITSDANMVSGKQYFVYDSASGSFMKFSGTSFTNGVYYYEIQTDIDEGIYYTQAHNPNITITFENGTRDCEYGKLLLDEDDYYIHLSNLAGEEVYLTLNVSLKRGSSNLQFTFRIKVIPNSEVNTTYPFADGANPAEFVSVSNSETIDLSDKLADNVLEDRKGKTRYNLTIGDVEYDDGASYFVKTVDLKKGLNGVYTISATSLVYDETKIHSNMLTGEVILEEVGYYTEVTLTINGTAGQYYVRTSDMEIDGVCTVVAGTEYYSTANKSLLGKTTIDEVVDSFTAIVISTSNYVAKEIVVGGNSSETLTGVTFNIDLLEPNATYSEQISGGVTYSIAYTIHENVYNFEIKSSDMLIANVSLTSNGILNITNANTDYFINLAVEKTYNNVVNSSQIYNIYINNVNGTYHVTVEDSASVDKVQINSETLTQLSTTLDKDTTFNLTTKYTVENGAGISGGSTQDLDLMSSFILRDKKGQVIFDEAEVQNIVNISIMKNPATTGKYTLTIDLADVIVQDYVLTISFTAKNRVITIFKIDILSSLVVSPKAEEDQTILGGSILDKDFILSNYNLKVNGSDVADLTLTSIDTDIVYLDETTRQIVTTNEDVENITIDVTLEIGSVEYKTSITFNIQKNITPIHYVEYGDEYRAGQEAEFDLGLFYVEDITLMGELTIKPVSIPETYRQYVKEIKLDTARNAIIFVSENVGQTIVGVTVGLEFVYTEGDYSFTFTSSISITIEPNAEINIVYPDPDGEDGEEIYSESVYYADTYQDFFESTAPFAEDERVSIKTLVAGVPVAKENALIRVKEIYGTELYALVKVKNSEEFGSYYLIEENNGAKVVKHPESAGETFDDALQYYYRFYPQHADTELNGLDQTFVFMQYSAYSDGYVTFEIEYNAVIVEYKVYVFNDIIEMSVVNTVNSVDGEEEIFLDQLSYGNILAEDMVAKVIMDPSVLSGTYYIKISNGNNSVNPYHWAGFEYNSSTGNSFYVFLGETGRLDIDVINGNKAAVKGDILGIYASKTATNDATNYLRNELAQIDLTSFVNINYKTIKNDRLTNVLISRGSHDYTSVLEAIRNKETTSSLEKPLFIYDGQYYTYDGSKNLTKVNGITASDLKKIVIGTYDVYDNYVKNTDGTITFISSFSGQVIETGENGFGQLVENVGTLGSTTTKVYSYNSDNGETIYVADEVDNIGTIYKNQIKTEEVYRYETNKNDQKTNTEIVASELTKQNTYYVYSATDGHNYYFKESDAVYDGFDAYKADTNIPVGKEVTAAAEEISGTYFRKFQDISGEKTNFILSDAVNGEGRYALASGITSENFSTFKSFIFDDAGDLQDEFDEAVTYYVDIEASGDLFKIKGISAYVRFGETQTYEKVDYKYVKEAYPSAESKTIDAGDFVILSTKTVITNTTAEKINEEEAGIVSINGVKYFVGNQTLNYSIPQNTAWTAKVSRVAEKITSDFIGVSGKKFNNQIILTTANGNQYLTGLTQVQIENFCGEGKETVVYSSTNATIYRAITTKAKFSMTTVPSITVVDEKQYYYVADENGNYKYVKAIDVNTYQYEDAYGLTDYFMASNETFNINNIESLVVGDSVEVKFQFILGKHIKQSTMKFKLYVDLEVQNSVFSENAAEAVGQLTNTVPEPDIKYNYIEIETNKTYDFNELVRVNKISTGKVINASDIFSTNSIQITVMKGTEEEFTNNEKLKSLKDFLSDELKSNEDVVRFSTELLTTQGLGNGNVFNFMVVPLGADNNGDYVIVKYEYSISIGDCYYLDTDMKPYVVTEYILFKISPDYKATMIDSEGNSVIVNAEVESINNATNPIEFKDFYKIGDLVAKTTLEDFEKLVFDENDGMASIEAVNTPSTEENIVYKFGKGMATIDGTGDDRYTAVLINSQTYYLDDACENDKVSKTQSVYENVLINLNSTESSLNQLVKITAQNAVNNTRDVSERVFDAELIELGAGDIDNYLSKEFSMFDENIVSKNNGGVRLKIARDVNLGKRDFIVAYTDVYGFKVEVYFSLVASSNPVYATGLLEYSEGSKFDIGAQFEVVEATEYSINDDIYYLDFSVKAGDKLGEGYYQFTPNAENAETNHEYFIALEQQGSDLTPAPDGTYAFKKIVYDGSQVDTLYNLVAVAKDTLVDSSNERTYYKKLSKVTSTSGAKVIFNMPYGINKDENGGASSSSIIYLSASEYIIVKSACLKATQVTLTVNQPVDPDLSGNNTYVDTIELAGIRAYGFKDNFVADDSIKSRDYFDQTINDVDKITVTDITFTYQNQEIAKVDPLGSTNTLATSASVKKYNSEDALGRGIKIDNFTIPILPGWIYGTNDYAYVTMNIKLTYKDGATEETYIVNVEIRVTKEESRIISENTTATNVSDGVTFNLSSHIKDADEFTFYDDTIAVTLPAQGKVSLNINAYDKRKTYYSYDGNGYIQVTNFDEDDFEDYYLCNDDGSYSLAKLSPDFTGTNAISSNYTKMDSTYYVGLSQLVGRTLGPDYYIDIQFSDYDLSKITRNGNFGFYASYKNGEGKYITLSGGTEQVFTNTQDIVFTHGFGQVQADAIVGKFTKIKISGTDFVVPTESIIYSSEGFSKVQAGTKYIPFSEFEKEDESGLTENMTISSWAEIWKDVLRIVDMGNLSNGKQVVTKYYIAKYNDASNTQYYQFVKNYNIFPTITNIETDDVNDRVYASANYYESGDQYYYFDISSWADQVTIYQYSSASSSGYKLSNIDKNCIYYEVGDKGTTSAEIDEDGTLSVKSSEYLLDGSRFVTINIYVKASGENGKYIDDNLSFSGNDYNRSVISIRVYLKDFDGEPIMTEYEETLDKLAKLEEYAEEYRKINSTYTKEQLVLMYVRRGNASYTSGTWNSLVGECPQEFIEYVSAQSDADYINELLTTTSVTPTAEIGENDFIHFIATLNMHKANTSQNRQDLGGWAGDLAQLIKEVKDGKDAQTLMGAESGSTFGVADYISDIDAIGVAKILDTSSMTVAGAMEKYYREYTNRSIWFLGDELGYSYDTAKTFEENKEALSSIIFTRIKNNLLITIWLNNASAGLASDDTTIGVACDAFARYVLLQCGYKETPIG